MRSKGITMAALFLSCIMILTACGSTDTTAGSTAASSDTKTTSDTKTASDTDTASDMDTASAALSQDSSAASDTAAPSVISEISGTAGSLSAEEAQSLPETEYTEKEISVRNGELNIYGVAKIPEGTGKFPTVIFSHGFGGNHDDCSTIQKTLAGHGIAVFSFDFCGGSGYSAGRIDGSMLDMSVFTEKSDLEAVLAMVRSSDFADPDRISLMGESQGGFVSAITANDHADEISGLYLVYPAFSIPDNARQAFSSADAIPDQVNIMGLTVGKAYFQDLLDYDVYEHIADFKGHVLIFHGTSDNIVDPSYSQKAAQVYENCSLTLIPGEGHGFSSETENEVGTAITEDIL